ncbi:MAG: hypothetical protein JEZ00_03850 [Anaerolineaceae bacterium]|nr:hypothetical protein [Anaerolineaceae bacterium]
MDTKIAVENERPPSIFQALVKGFNTIANHAYLLILPFLLDIFLWIGPNLSTSKTLNTFINLMEKSIQQQITQPGMTEQLSQFETIHPLLVEFANTFNLFGFLTTTPIGVPSLLSFQSVPENPFGMIQKIATTSMTEEFLYLVGLVVIGSFLGGIFFSEIGRKTHQNAEQQFFSFAKLGTDILWMVLINFSLWIMVILVLFPSMAIAVLANMINQTVGNIIYFVLLLVLFWVIIPLVFTPHGVIIQRQNPIKAILASIRLIRFYLPGTGFFILFSLLLYQGLNQLLWLQPKFSSFMLLGGIFGHAFICSGLLASSFIYYQDGIRWMNHNLKKFAQQSNQTSRPFQA